MANGRDYGDGPDPDEYGVSPRAQFLFWATVWAAVVATVFATGYAIWRTTGG